MENEERLVQAFLKRTEFVINAVSKTSFNYPFATLNYIPFTALGINLD